MKYIIILGFSLLLGTQSVISADSAGAPKPKSYQIRNVNFGDLLRPENASNADGARIVLHPAQPWKCMTWKLNPVGESVFQLQNHFTSKTICAGAGETNTPLVQAALPRETGKHPLWRFNRLGDGHYQIADPESGRVLTAISFRGRIVVVLADWADKAVQKWDLIETDPNALAM